MKREAVFKNTFEPTCGDRELRVSGIVAGLRFGVFRYSSFPPDVRKAVDEELERMAREGQKRSGKDDWKLNMLDIEMREVQRTKNSKSEARPDMVRLPGIQTLPSLLVKGVRGQSVYIKQGAVPNEPAKIVARIESK
ncbi:MAG: hypothetical protein OXU37_03990 [Thaumarchaeota archaeon]|nr:hypothetical protein [Nitrososphaerota archaeon]